MAKQLLRAYIFAPGAAGLGTISMPGKWDLNQFLIITNTTKNIIIYNFADTTYVGTSVTFSRSNNANFPTILQTTDGVTTVNLSIDTSDMNAGDSLQIFVEKGDLIIRPWAFGTDAIERMRVSNPKSMIDADFEYGLQPTKWAGYGLMRGYPSTYEYPGVDLVVLAITTDYITASSSNSLITVTTTNAHNVSAGQAVNITGLLSSTAGFSRADGNFIVFDVLNATSLRYFANGVVGTSNSQSLLTDATVMKRGNIYTGASLATTSASGNGADPTVITVNFSSNHGLIPGCPIYCAMSGGSNPTNATGQFIVTSVPTLNTITFTARTGAVVTPGTPTVYALSNSSVTHRPFDGGVILTCKTPTFGASTVRVSKKYFRYQSGKGLLWSTGTMFKPSYDIQSITANAATLGSTITVKVDDIDHGLQIGAFVTIGGVITSGYNGTYLVNAIIDDYTFTYVSTSALGATTGVLEVLSKVAVSSWHGAVVRAGCFDDQNGMFWEYTGSVLCAVRRNATQQLTGTLSINANANSVTGTNTRFKQQVRAGDKITIRGMTHYVTEVINDTSMNVTPDFRGSTNVVGVKSSLVQETRIPQSQFNVDKLDGTGPSGFLFDAGKMQMMGIQYTWYGAGFIDYMVRGGDGNWVFAHRIKNNNVNTEAHMRTGNLPVRYSIDNDGSPAVCYLTADPGSGGLTLAVNDTTYFPSTGTLYIDNELISYSGKTQTSFTNCVRNATLTQWITGAVRSSTAATATGHTAGTGIILVSNTASPTLSHWGSALICDGGFDEDRGYIFNYQRAAMSISATTATAFLIRLAPSVSNSAVGDLGSKDLLNRSQLLLNAVAVQTYGAGPANGQGSIIIEGILNPKNYSTATWSALNFESVGGQPSLAQVTQTITWAAGPGYAIPGEQVFAFAGTPNSDNRLELTELKELTNSPFGGVGAYPNGPDTLAINVRTAAGNTNATILLRWGEAQA